jgi:lipoprotein NlpI
VQLFDRYLESEPEEMPGLWQRGIALYFVGDYRRAAKQFEEHRKVNPHDVENAAWHFLCVAKSDSVAAARNLVLPAPNDPRIPMEEVHRMLTSGNTGAVEQRVAGLPEGSKARAEAAFYGDFYLGLYADAGGRRETARAFVSRAAKDAPHHYMGDVARVYAKHLAVSDK